MHYFQPVATVTLISLGTVCGTSSAGATEFMLGPQMLIKPRTTYMGVDPKKNLMPLSSQEIVAWLREEGIPIAVIAEITGVERKSVYAWLDGNAVKPHNQDRLEKIYFLLNENKLAHLRQLYRFWSRNVLGERSLGSMFTEKVLDEISIRHALTLLWPLAKKEEIRESSNYSNSSIKSNPFLQEFREVTTSYDA